VGRKWLETGSISREAAAMAATIAHALCTISLGTSLTSPPSTRTHRIASVPTNAQGLSLRGVCGGAGIASSKQRRVNSIRWSAAESQPTSTTTAAAATEDSWVPVIPTSALPRGERRLIRQDADTVLLLWYKDELYAVENSSPAEGAYSEGMFNARLTPDGCIVCPSTETTFDLKTGEIKDWYPTNPILAFLTKPTRILTVYPVKTDGEYVYINTRRGQTGETAEIVFGGAIQAGKTADDVSVDEVRMVVDEGEKGFGFTPYTESVNGRAAMLGCTMLILTELVSGKGFLKGIGFLDFLYQYIK
jgi:nitrite reductase/ring-hydroxylating ferredoxin subunit